MQYSIVFESFPHPRHNHHSQFTIHEFTTHHSPFTIHYRPLPIAHPPITFIFGNMKLLTAIIATLVFLSCNSEDQKKETLSENDTDAARNFIRAALDGKWDDARKYMVQDSTNMELIDRSETMYSGMDRQVKRSYRESNIRFYETRVLNDSVTIINYSNTYKNEKDSLKVVKTGGQWLIDLKYSLLPVDSVSNAQ